jgi:predicted membrane chloride channel (bestrophin family)
MNTRAMDQQRRVWFFGRVSLLLLGIEACRVLVHRQHWEVLTPNPLFSALVASEVFLLGFLLNGVLTDYKEGEKLPGELAAALESIALEVQGLPLLQPGAEVTGSLALLANFSEALLAWMQKAGPTLELLEQLNDLQLAIEKLGCLYPAPLQARLLLELAHIRRGVQRIDVIRSTTFVPSVYGMAYIGTAVLTIGLVLSRIEPFAESLFFIGVISFLLIKLLLLITDLDNPFGSAQALSVENVSLLPVADAVMRLRRMAEPGPTG